MSRERGFTLLELIISISIVGILASLALPSFQGIIANARTRSTTESFNLALQLARTEAIKRNARVAFRFETTGAWTVCSSVSTTVQANCATDDIVQIKKAAEASSNVTITPTPTGTAMITFTGTGRPYLDASLAWKNPDGTNEVTSIDFSSTSGSNAYRVMITSSGSIKLCNPNLAPGNVKACS